MAGEAEGASISGFDEHSSTQRKRRSLKYNQAPFKSADANENSPETYASDEKGSGSDPKTDNKPATTSKPPRDPKKEESWKRAKIIGALVSGLLAGAVSMIAILGYFGITVVHNPLSVALVISPSKNAAVIETKKVIAAYEDCFYDIYITNSNDFDIAIKEVKFVVDEHEDIVRYCSFYLSDAGDEEPFYYDVTVDPKTGSYRGVKSNSMAAIIDANSVSAIRPTLNLAGPGLYHGHWEIEYIIRNSTFKHTISSMDLHGNTEIVVYSLPGYQEYDYASMKSFDELLQLVQKDYGHEFYEITKNSFHSIFYEHKPNYYNP